MHPGKPEGLIDFTCSQGSGEVSGEDGATAFLARFVSCDHAYFREFLTADVFTEPHRAPLTFGKGFMPSQMVRLSSLPCFCQEAVYLLKQDSSVAMFHRFAAKVALSHEGTVCREVEGKAVLL